MDKDNPKPEIIVEIGIQSHKVFYPVSMFHATHWNFDPFKSDVGGDVNAIKKSGRLMQKSKNKNPTYPFYSSAHTPRSGREGMAHVFQSSKQTD